MNFKVVFTSLLRHSLQRLILRPTVCTAARSFSSLSSANQLDILRVHIPNLQIYRYKSRRKGKGKAVNEEAESSDDEGKEDNEEEETEEASAEVDIPGTKIVTFRATSSRVDRLLQAVIGFKLEVDTAFLQGNIRRNEEKVLKKGTEVHEGDILDLVRGDDEVNGNFLRVSRLEVMEIQNHGNSVHIRGRFTKDLLIKHYDT